MYEPTYEIGDRIAGTNITICGVMTLSNGKRRYFLAIGDNNSLVVDDEEIEVIIELIKPLMSA